jgi:hypothetical protein
VYPKNSTHFLGKRYQRVIKAVLLHTTERLGLDSSERQKVVALGTLVELEETHSYHCLVSCWDDELVCAAHLVVAFEQYY